MSDTRPTKDAILEHAREAFNDLGIEAVGMRDLARALGLSPGNVTYHFATKEDIIMALADELGARNDEVHRASREPRGLDDFVEGFRPLFRNQWAYRGLTLAVVHLSDHYPSLRSRYAARQRRRTDAFRSKLEHLGRMGSLAPSLGREELERLVATLSLIGRFWISESRLDRHDVPIERTIDHYLGVLAGALLGSASAKGREELRRFLHGRDRST